MHESAGRCVPMFTLNECLCHGLYSCVVDKCVAFFEVTKITGDMLIDKSLYVVALSLLNATHAWVVST